jgi:hypothetical protein
MGLCRRSMGNCPSVSPRARSGRKQTEKEGAACRRSCRARLPLPVPCVHEATRFLSILKAATPASQAKAFPFPNPTSQWRPSWMRSCPWRPGTRIEAIKQDKTNITNTVTVRWVAICSSLRLRVQGVPFVCAPCMIENQRVQVYQQNNAFVLYYFHVHK